MLDLFERTKTKKELVFDFIKTKRWARTSEVIAFGLSIYHTRADRDARELAKEGLIRRMPEDLKRLRFSGTKECVWEFIN